MESGEISANMNNDDPANTGQESVNETMDRDCPATTEQESGQINVNMNNDGPVKSGQASVKTNETMDSDGPATTGQESVKIYETMDGDSPANTVQESAQVNATTGDDALPNTEQIEPQAGEQPQEINLHVDGEVFTVNKEAMRQKSDYFRAMFSGKFLEKDKRDITIDVIDAYSMDIILRYIEIGEFDMTEFSIPVLRKLALATNFLQIADLSRHIRNTLDCLLNCSNWMDIMIICERAAYPRLLQRAGSFGLLEFKNVKPESIPNIRRLFWYLSNPSLNVGKEVDVFRFGFDWVSNSNQCVCGCDNDVLLLILGCLDLSRLTMEDLKEMSVIISVCKENKAAKLIECLKVVIDNNIPLENVNRNDFLQTRISWNLYDPDIYGELCSLVRNNNKRKNLLTPVVPIWNFKDGELDYAPHYVSVFIVNQGEPPRFMRFMEVADKNLWGWSIAAWGVSKLVQVCGEIGRGTGRYMRDVKVYDTLRNSWSSHGVLLPKRRHAGVVVNGDLLYIIGGVGEFRVTQDTTIVYDLKTRKFTERAKFPDVLQSPAVCSYYGTVYAGAQKNIYKYEDLDVQDRWVQVASTDIRANHMVAFQEHIYCTQSFFSNLYRFRPGIDTSLEMIAICKHPPAALINVGDKLAIFTRPVCGQSKEVSVEVYRGPGTGYSQVENAIGDLGPPHVVYCKTDSDFTVNDIAGACALVLDTPDISWNISDYHNQYLSQFAYWTYPRQRASKTTWVL